MNADEKASQQAFDSHTVREKACAEWLKQLSRSVRWEIISAASAGVIEGLALIGQAWLLADMLQQAVIEKAAVTNFIVPIQLFIALIILRAGSVFFKQQQGFSAGSQIKFLVQKELLKKLAVLGPASNAKKQSGELAAVIIEQTEALVDYFSGYLPQQIIAAIVPVILILTILPVNWVVAVILCITGPLIPLFMALIGLGAAAAKRQQFLALSRMGGYFLDRLQGMVTLKLFDQAENEQQRIAKVAEQFRYKTMAVLRLAFLSSAVLEFFSAIAVALVAVYVGLGLLGLIKWGPAAEIDLRQGLFVLLLAPEFFKPLRQLAVHYHDKAAALGAADVVLGVLQQTPPAAPVAVPSLSSAKAVLAMQRVSKHYAQREVLQDINFTVAAGEKIAISGASGAGKSTLFKLMLGFEEASSGNIFLDGRPRIRERASQQIAWLGQRAYLFYGSILDNIKIADPGATQEAVYRAADAAGVAEFSDKLPEGLNSLVGERGYGLSGGQVQRIALARVLLKQAPIILLDEPLASLDVAWQNRFLQDIEQLFTDHTLIISTHNPQVIAHMQRTLLLQQGRLYCS